MAVLTITFSGGIGMILSLPIGLNSLERNDIVLLPLTLGLKAQKHLARAERQSRPELMYQIIFALQGQKRSYALSVRRKVVIVLHFAIPINFTQANYLTFRTILSPNAGDFLRSVGLGVDFFDFQSV